MEGRSYAVSENKTKGQLLMEMIESQYFPYPIAVFTRDGVLNRANQRFLDETNRSVKDVVEGKINMHDRLTTD